MLFASSLRSSHNESLQQLSGISDILAENSQAALVFGDRTEAKRLLEALQEHREIDSAWMLDAKGNTLAAWNRNGLVKPAPADYRVDAKQIRSEFWSKDADLFRPVVRGKERIGYILLQADFTERWNSHLADFETGLAVFALSLAGDLRTGDPSAARDLASDQGCRKYGAHHRQRQDLRPARSATCER